MDSIEALLKGDEREILEDSTNWPENLVLAIDVVESRISNQKNLHKYIRPLLYLAAQDNGPMQFSISSPSKATEFAIKKSLYDCFLNDPETAQAEAHRQGYRGTAWRELLQFQAEAHGTSPESENRKVQKWHKTIIQLMDSLRAKMTSLDLSSREIGLMQVAMIAGLAFMRLGTASIYIPSCKKITSKILHVHVMKHMKDGDVAATARYFNISSIHVYRIIREERQRKKEAHNQAMK